ncbi:hypothetical protein [Rhodopirellula europaea]|uniref:hypothetical protein n=1 Tax=Rhodopirellula europaea TaxID=1263866 RepID=UPI003D28F86B
MATSQCFGTKRGVIQAPSQQQPSPAKNKRQVEPGLRAGKSGCHQNQNPNASARDHTNI